MVNLLDVEFAANVWARQFDVDWDVESLYAIEDEISLQISAVLADRIGVMSRILASKSRRKPCHDLTSYEAALKMWHWGVVLTDDAFSDAWQSLDEAVKREPDFALTKAMLADVYASDFLSDIGLVKNRMATAEVLARDAVALDPCCPDARWVMGFVHFLNRRPDLFLREFEEALSLNPNNAMVMAIFGLFLPGLGEWKRSLELIDQARMLNPNLSAQYHIPAYLDCYRRGEYEEAHEISLSINMPGLYWESLFGASILGRLDQTDQAREHLDRLLEKQPQFRKQGRELARRLLYSEENLDLVFGGLDKAGFTCA